MATNGLIRYYGLVHWWESALTAAERERLEELFHPLGASTSRPLTEGMIQREEGPTATTAGLLSGLVGWLRPTPDDTILRRKIRTKLLALTATETNIVARHFSLQVLIREFYRDRDRDPDARAAAIQACRDQIAIAPAVAADMQERFPGRLPRHIGYEQLAIVQEKDKAYPEAIAVCQEAAKAGWDGHWQRRIDRCRRHMEKAGLAPDGTTSR